MKRMIKPVTRKEYEEVLRIAQDALRMASVHDPEHERRLGILERQVTRLGAPEYRTVGVKRKVRIWGEIAKLPKSVGSSDLGGKS